MKAAEYETKMIELTRITDRLESPDLSLEENIELYNRAKSLHEELSSFLTDQIGKVQLINKDQDIKGEWKDDIS